MELPVEALHEARCPYSSSSMGLQSLSTALLQLGKYFWNGVCLQLSVVAVGTAWVVNAANADVVDV